MARAHATAARDRMAREVAAASRLRARRMVGSLPVALASSLRLANVDLDTVQDITRGAYLSLPFADDPPPVGRQDGASRESKAPDERPPTTWEGLLRGERPRCTAAESARYIHLMAAGDASDGGLGGRVRSRLDAHAVRGPLGHAEPLSAEPRRGHQLRGRVRERRRRRPGAVATRHP